jgi:hypothetical protein
MYATTGDRQLLWLLPGVQEAERKLRAFAASKGITYVIANFGGARTEQIVAQLLRWRDEAVAQGEPWYRVSPFKSTKHSRGGAFDIRITTTPKGMTKDAAYRILGMQAPQYGLIWGGTFSAPSDPFHFESQQPLSKLEARWAEWINDPRFPQGYTDWLTIAIIAFVGAVVLFFLLPR